MFSVVKSKVVTFKNNKNLTISGSCYVKKFGKFEKTLPSQKNSMKV